MKRFSSFFFLAAMLLPACAQDAPDVNDKARFFEAENFEVQGAGWRAVKNGETKKASMGTALLGALGDGAGTATQNIEIPRAGK